MKCIKRILFVVSVIAVAGLFVACGNKDTNMKDDNDGVTATEDAGRTDKDDHNASDNDANKNDTNKNDTDKNDNNGDDIINDVTDDIGNGVNDVIDGVENGMDDLTGDKNTAGPSEKPKR